MLIIKKIFELRSVSPFKVEFKQFVCQLGCGIEANTGLGKKK
jgi:hypothetical protein